MLKKSRMSSFIKGKATVVEILAGTGSKLEFPTAGSIKKMAENANDKEKGADLAIKVAVSTNNEKEPPNGVPMVANVQVIPAVSRMKVKIVGLHDPLCGHMCD